MYKITLFNTIFDSNNDNVLLFDNKSQLKSYFDNMTDKYIVGDNINFIANNIINTSIYVNINNSNRDKLLKILNYNYCMVENNDNGDVLYFFITESSQDNGDLIKLSLQLDVINTYYYDISPDTLGYIKRSHLDRWVKPKNESQSTNKRVLAFGAESKLYDRESIQNVSQRAVKRYKLKTQFKYDEVSEWFDKNVDHYVYYYLSSGTDYDLYNADGEKVTKQIPGVDFRTQEATAPLTTNIGPFVVLVAPVYKTLKRIYVRGKNFNTNIIYAEFDEKAIDVFLSQNNGYAYVKAIKHSCKPPFNPMSIHDYEIDSTGNLKLSGSSSLNNADYGYFREGQDEVTFATGGLNVVAQNRAYGIVLSDIVDVPIKMITPNKMYIDSIDLSGELPQDWGDIEPKIYNEDYSKYRLNFGGQLFDLPISKTSSQPCFKYYEILGPDITKSILVFDSENPINRQGVEAGYYKDEVFSEIQRQDFTGSVLSIDLSEWFTTDNLDSYLATNKNNLQIMQNNQNLEMRNVIRGGILSVLMSYSSPESVLPTGVGALNNIYTTMQSQKNEIKNYNLTLDNMAQSPQSVNSLNSNLFLIQSLGCLQFYIELMEPLEYDLQKIKDYFKMYGYSFNSIDKIKSLLYSRDIYNYIEASLIDIDLSVSEQIKTMLSAVFNKGIRFWHADKFTGIDFNKPNMEVNIND